MWSTFHTLVAAATATEAATPAQPTAGYATEDSAPVKVLLAIRGYVDAFFGCRECADNFMKDAASLPQGLPAHQVGPSL